jgi:hypothetical protein
VPGLSKHYAGSGHHRETERNRVYSSALGRLARSSRHFASIEPVGTVFSRALRRRGPHAGLRIRAERLRNSGTQIIKSPIFDATAQAVTGSEPSVFHTLRRSIVVYT